MQGATVSRIAQTITQFFNKTATKYGHETKFVQRQSKISAQLFVESLTSACLNHEKVSLEEICRLIKHRGVKLTKQGLAQRFNTEANQLMKQLLDDSLKTFKVEQPVMTTLLQPFSGVKILDSSGVELPSSLKQIYKGYGGGASNAALKLQVLLDDTAGQIEHLSITSATQNDQGFTHHLGELKKGALYLQDLGYFRIESFIAIQEAEAYFLSRYLPQTLLFNEQAQPFDLLKELHKTEAWLEQNIFMGKKKKIPVRLTAQRVSEEIKQKRLNNIYKSYRKNTPSQLVIELAGWSIYVTNIPSALLTKEQIHFVYVLRWQIELFFKLCKGYAGINKISGKNHNRIMCELYARLINLIIFLYLCTPVRWQQAQELSFPKAYKQLKKSSQAFFKALTSPYRLIQCIKNLISDFASLALKDKKTKKKLTSYQKLFEFANGEAPC